MTPSFEIALTLYLILYCVVAYLSSNVAARPDLRILAGRDAEPGEFPYVVRIEYYVKITGEGKTKNISMPVCTGSALKPAWTLSARHCAPECILLRLINKKNFTEEYRAVIRYGDPTGKPSAHDSFSLILKCELITEKRSNRRIYEDVALFNTEPVIIDKYAKISAVEFTSLLGHSVSTVGYGLVKTSSNEFKSTVDLEKPLQVLDKAMLKTCDISEVYCPYPSISLVEVCGEAKMPIFGDSGAPVLHISGIIGVISTVVFYNLWNMDELTSRKSGVTVTPISPYLDWILNMTYDK